MGIEITNIASVNSDFVKLNKLTAKKLNKELNISAEEISTDAKRKITADNHVVTGRLRSSIHVAYPGGDSYVYSNKIGEGFNGSLDVILKNNERAIGTNVVYANKIEDVDSYLEYASDKNEKGFIQRIKNIINEANRQ